MPEPESLPVHPPMNEDGQNPSTFREESAYRNHLALYEEFIGAPQRRRRSVEIADQEREEWIVISDLHIPDERMDLLQRVAKEHAGSNLVIAGDLNDMEQFGRWDVKTWGLPCLKDLLARTDAIFEFLSKHFTKIRVLFGNHDLRIPRQAARSAGPDLYWLTQEFLMQAYESRHGVEVVRHDITKRNGRTVSNLHYWHQIGDCLISHVETCGKPVGRGAERAHDVLVGLQETLGIEPFKVLLHAHTHKQAYFRHSLTHTHCFEIGCLCDVPAFQLLDPRYGPPRHGFYHLVQYNKQTAFNESRLVCLDED